MALSSEHLDPTVEPLEQSAGLEGPAKEVSQELEIDPSLPEQTSRTHVGPSSYLDMSCEEDYDHPSIPHSSN